MLKIGAARGWGCEKTDAGFLASTEWEAVKARIVGILGCLVSCEVHPAWPRFGGPSTTNRGWLGEPQVQGLGFRV